MRKWIFFFFLLLSAGWMAQGANDITFKASAPSAVAMGEQFRLTYTVIDAEEGRNVSNRSGYGEGERSKLYFQWIDD